MIGFGKKIGLDFGFLTTMPSTKACYTTNETQDISVHYMKGYQDPSTYV